VPKTPETHSEAEVKHEPAAPEAIVHVEAPVEKPAEVTVEKVFDPHSISEAVFQSTKKDITAFIIELNGIIRARNYSQWVAHLAPSYFTEISSRSFLEEKTEELYRRDMALAQTLGRDPKLVEKRILRTAQDYFIYVVVPSRAEDRLDDISFLSETRVRAYTINERGGQRLVLYDLASINSNWLIVN
jgi:hypothetical protein